MTGAPSDSCAPTIAAGRHLPRDTLVLWLTLARLPGAGPRTQRTLIEHFGSVENIFSASRGQLEKILAGKHETVSAILDGPGVQTFESEFDWLGQPAHHLLVWSDADYPPLLREIADPPLLLYVIGRREALASPQLAIVGSRNPSPMGRENAQAFAKSLAGAGLAITSGLALGVDGAAHRGALAAGGHTIAVTGTGLDRVYPARHRELAHAIAARGALVSEFPLGTSPRPENFPRRNRLISGLSLGTLVVEAALQSGSLITARLAAEQGREVFAIPGSIHAPQARGCHALIRQGAKLVETAQDIVVGARSADGGAVATNRSRSGQRGCVDRTQRIDGGCRFLHAVANGAERTGVKLSGRQGTEDFLTQREPGTTDERKCFRCADVLVRKLHG